MTAEHNVVNDNINLVVNSTLSDYMITLSMIVIPAWNRNPGSMDGFKLTIPGTGYPLPVGYDELFYNLTK
jgi:hypothetical protein